MAEENIIERSIHTTIATFSTWLLRYINQIKHHQQFSVFDASQPKVFINCLTTYLDPNPELVRFDLEVENTEEEGPNGENKIDVIKISARQRHDSVHLTINYKKQIYLSFVSTLLLDSINNFPATVSEIGDSVVSLKDEIESDNPSMEKIKLSPTKKSILSLWKAGIPDSGIANQMSLSVGRVRNIITELRKKLTEKEVPYHRHKKKKS